MSKKEFTKLKIEESIKDSAEEYMGKAFGALKQYAKKSKKTLTDSEISDIAWNSFVNDEYSKNN